MMQCWKASTCASRTSRQGTPCSTTKMTPNAHANQHPPLPFSNCLHGGYGCESMGMTDTRGKVPQPPTYPLNTQCPCPSPMKPQPHPQGPPPPIPHPQPLPPSPACWWEGVLMWGGQWVNDTQMTHCPTTNAYNPLQPIRDEEQPRPPCPRIGWLTYHNPPPPMGQFSF